MTASTNDTFTFSICVCVCVIILGKYGSEDTVKQELPQKSIFSGVLSFEDNFM